MLALSLAVQTANSSQRRAVTKAEIDSLERNAEAKLEKLSYREKRTPTYFVGDDKSPNSTSTRIVEVVLRPNRVRWVSGVERQARYPADRSDLYRQPSIFERGGRSLDDL
jgi:hypothetical protein